MLTFFAEIIGKNATYTLSILFRYFIDKMVNNSTTK